MIKTVSNSPIVLTHNSDQYIEIINLLNEATLNSNPVDFEFYNSRNINVENKYRKINRSSIISSNHIIKKSIFNLLL